MIKMALYLAGFFLVYRVFLSSDTLYSRNRVYILFSLIASFILPLITVQVTSQLNLPLFGGVLSEIFVSGITGNTSSGVQDISAFSAYKWSFIIYIAGVIFFGLKLVFDFLELFFLITRQKTDGEQDYKIPWFKYGRIFSVWTCICK